jgi:hypothetical protein
MHKMSISTIQATSMMLRSKKLEIEENNVCLLVLFIAAWAIFQLSGGCHHYRLLGCTFRPMLGNQGLWAGRDLYRATPTAIRDFGLYGLIGKTDTHVPQWGSNPQLKGHQIFEPDALSTAPRRLNLKEPSDENQTGYHEIDPNSLKNRTMPKGINFEMN